MSNIQIALEGGAPVFEWLHRDTAGEDIECEVRLVRLPDPTRDLVRASIVDIRERKMAEQALREAQERAQTILETISLPMVITRLADNVLTFVNEPALEVVQIAYDDLINKPAPAFYYKQEEREQFIKELQEKGRVSNMEVQLLRSDGTPFWALLSARVFNYQGEPSILTTFSDVTERVRAQESVARRAAELATVAEIGTTISTILEEQQLLETIVQLTQRRFDLYHCHIFILDEQGQTLQVQACGWEEGSPHTGKHGDVAIALDEEQSLVAQSARKRESVIVNNVRNDPNWLPNEQLPETNAEMAVPIIAGGQVLGVLDVQAKEVDRFTDADISIMTTLASQMAVALQNARTYAQTQQQAEYEAMINQISQRIQSTTSVESALQVAIRELGRALGAKRANIQLGLPTQPKSK
jgi:PAS domain S-box-containing protein